MMQGTFDNVRFIMSDELTVTNGNALNYTVRALDEIEESRVETNDFFAGLTGDSECIEAISARWETELDTAGDSISACANTADLSIETMTNNVYTILEASQKISTDLQNIVVDGFIGWNPIDAPDALSIVIDAKLTEIYTNWYAETVPALEAALDVVVQSSSVIPSEVNVCVFAVVESITDSSETLRDEAIAC